MNRPEPTGAVTVVEPEDIFFSTTDHKGVILKANSVFVAISRYRWDQLVGQPHNIIRHPAMPGAAFLAMWDTRLAGEPFCAYVHNLAADGSTYTVLASVVPLGEDFLSVRIAPQREDLLAACDAVYEATLQAEAAAGQEGCGAPERARRGLPVLLDTITSATGVEPMAFLRSCLVKEVSTRRRANADQPPTVARRGAMGGPRFEELVAQVDQVMDVVNDWAKGLEDIEGVVDDAHRVHDAVAAALEESSNTAEAFTRAAGEGAGARPLVNSLGLWTRMSGEVNQLVEEVAAHLDALADDAARTAFRLALAYIQVESLRSFVAELRARVEGWEHALPVIEDLARAVEESLAQAQQTMASFREQSRASLETMAETAELMTMPADLLGSWVALASRPGMPREVTDLVPVITAQANGTRDLADQLNGVVTHLHDLAEGTATRTVSPDQFARIRGAAAAVAAQPLDDDGV